LSGSCPKNIGVLSLTYIPENFLQIPSLESYLHSYGHPDVPKYLSFLGQLPASDPPTRQVTMHSSKDSNSFATVSMGTSCKRASCDVGCAAAISGQGERWELGIEAGLNNVTRTTLSRSPAYLGAEFYSRRASGKFSRVDGV